MVTAGNDRRARGRGDAPYRTLRLGVSALENDGRRWKGEKRNEQPIPDTPRGEVLTQETEFRRYDRRHTPQRYFQI